MSSILEESKKAKKRGFLGLFKNRRLIFGVIIIIIIFGSANYFFKKDNTDVEEAQPKEYTVKRGNIEIAIQADGKVVAEDGVELSFSVTGDTLEVENVYVNEGQDIKKGDKIATVKTSTLELSLRNAYSSYQSALANYNEKLAGATDDDKADAQDSIKSAESSLNQAKLSFEDTKQSTANSIYNAEQAVDEALKDLNKNRSLSTSEDINDAYDDLVDSIKSTSISLEGILGDSDEIIGVDNTYINDDFEVYLGVKKTNSLTYAEGSYDLAKADASTLDLKASALTYNSVNTDIDSATIQAESALSVMDKHLYDMKVMLDASVTGSGFTQSELDSYKSTIFSNRTSVNTKITALTTATQAVTDAIEGLDDYVTDYNDAVRDLDNAKSSADRDIETAEANIASKEMLLKQAKRNYDDLIAPLTDAEMASARQSLTSASISLERARNDLDEATLTSPIDGKVSSLNYKAGDIIIASDNNPVVEIVNTNTLFIEINIEEADISKLKVGDQAVATFDALDGATVSGEISFISLTSETSSNGIVTYLVRVLLDNYKNLEIREGMTASVKFVTAGVSDVLTAPVAAVRNVSGKPSVQLVGGEWAPVTTGFTDGSSVEIISGVNEGDKLVY